MEAIGKCLTPTECEIRDVLGMHDWVKVII